MRRSQIATLVDAAMKQGIGASGKVSVKDANGRIVKRFNSVQIAKQFMDQFQ